ncbi:MAG: hypothetical protein AAF211_02425 [Myxococcota bacterium]
MAVTIVQRTPYAGVTGLRRQTYDDRDLLTWLQRNWADFGNPNVEAEGFDAIRGAYGAPWPASPVTMDEARHTLQAVAYVHGEVRTRDHAVMIYDDDDDVEYATFVFDDAFLAEHGADAAFLLLEDWQLPEGLVRTKGPRWVAFGAVEIHASDNLETLEGPHLFEGHRLDTRAVRRDFGGWAADGIYWRWWLYDDRWHAAHPELANGLARFVGGWNALGA